MAVTKTLGAIELGGTKTVVAIGTSDGEVRKEERFPTTQPEETLQRAVDWLKNEGEFDHLGVASFGPIRVDPKADDFGTMLATPKAGWKGFPVAKFLSDAFSGIDVMLDTDVNAAALSESKLGAAKGFDDVVYITVGTGIGGGVLSGGRLIHGVIHPEFGHLKVPRSPGDDFVGCCPFHKDCLEGMASGPAIQQRWGIAGSDLPEDHPAWETEAWYLAHGILSLLAILSPSIVVLGGGVPQARGLHDRVNRILKDIAGGYFPILEADHPFVVPPALGQEAGIKGALLL
ncbi:ROK family protein [Luteolibacter pohnpeiensis]|uniref:fructokinase n=1 Tax=Luteolibacter pohnpeiensis TaxID=454153 RepID=A0A934VX95_9BACT|nr:ROK family protein [Luteolibacter pohnpeiensis]MBK1883598.1 ROK family protein [Luteolibacter pohnpeiensis]